MKILRISLWFCLALVTTGIHAASIDEVEALRLQGDYAGALERAKAELDIDAENPRLLNLAGSIEFETGQVTAAETRFRRVIELGGLDTLMAKYHLARMELHRGERAAATALFEQIRAAQQTQFGLDARDLYAIAGATAWLGRSDPQLFKQAVRIYDDAIRRDPSDLSASITLGELLLEKYNNQEAQQAFRQVLDKNDRHPRALLGLARSQHFDYSTEAVVTALSALQFNPRLVPARVFMARLFIELEQYGDARHEAELALEVNPQSLEALSMLGAINHLERNTEAFDAIEQRVLAINPEYADFYNTLADLAAHNRLYRDAVGFATRAVTLDPQSWRGHGLLGMNQLRIGQMRAGRKSLDQSFAGDPYNVWIKNTLQLADSFREYVEVEKDRFVVVLHGEENDLLREYVETIAREAYAAFKTRYRHDPEQRIRLEMYPDHADFSVRTVGLAGVGLLGVCFGPVVAMDSPAARTRGAFNWGSTLWHELAHVFHLSITDNRVPRWFSEGLAVYEEQIARPGWGGDVDPGFLLAYLDGRLLPVSQLNNGFVRPTYPEQVAHSYFQASLVFEFIDARWGFDVIRDTLYAYRESSGPETLLQRLQIDAETLDADFDQFLRDKYATALAALEGGDSVSAELDPSRPPDTTEVPDRYFEQLRFGNLLFEQENDELAELFLRKAQQLFPEYAGGDSAYWLLAALYARQGDYERAEAELAKMIAINAEHYEAHRSLARLRAQRGDDAGAAAALEAAIYIYPYDLDLHEAMAQHQAALENWSLVARARRSLLALDPVDRAEAFYQLAFAYHQAGDRAGAREQILYALEIAPNFTLAQDLLLTLHEAGKASTDAD